MSYIWWRYLLKEITSFLLLPDCIPKNVCCLKLLMIACSNFFAFFFIVLSYLHSFLIGGQEKVFVSKTESNVREYRACCIVTWCSSFHQQHPPSVVIWGTNTRSDLVKGPKNRSTLEDAFARCMSPLKRRIWFQNHRVCQLLLLKFEFLAMVLWR